ncbi:MAG: hypothetical protein JO360_17735 [Acidobacteria bacterium]|nr:hypothetical protein [Acidobacteriota bacterium]
MSAQSMDAVSAMSRPSAFQTVLIGGLIVGVLDGSAALISAGLKGVTPVQVFQYIASGLLGPASYKGGWATVLLGVFCHFLIAMAATVIYYLASLKIPLLARQPVICGMLYGVAVYFFMARVVTPLSHARTLPFSLSQFMIHLFVVGLSIGLVTWRASRKKLS